MTFAAYADTHSGRFNSTLMLDVEHTVRLAI
ncbi:hypothetical protein FHT40_006743, partial [Mycolicibacterium sp. BK556]|nr:hypothetical protein [Mycolicibacterium sp. BK556]MBB3636847.1 hypothetical protein [Mycolicibacterium sp. BK607]